MEADSYTLHFQIYVSGVTSTADPTASEREGERKEERKTGRTGYRANCTDENINNTETDRSKDNKSGGKAAILEKKRQRRSATQLDRKIQRGRKIQKGRARASE